MFVDNILINCVKREGDVKCVQRKSDKDYMQVIKDKVMGVLLIKRANKKLLPSIRKQHAFNFNMYLKKLHNAYKLLKNHSSGTHQNR